PSHQFVLLEYTRAIRQPDTSGRSREPLFSDLSDGPRARSSQMPREVLVHLEHGHLVLAEDALELVVGQDLTAVLGVLQVVGLDVLPDLAHDLAPGHRSWADYCGQRLGRLQRPL